MKITVEPTGRAASAQRTTRETRITARVDLEMYAEPIIETGIGFLDHMLIALATHSRIGLELRCAGDLVIDDHHTAEDCAIVLGSLIDAALGERRGIARFGYAFAPMDEALARACIDLSGRPAPVIDLGLRRERIGAIASENLVHVLISVAIALRAAVHVDVLRGDNDHHRAEAAFKALALALRAAIAQTGSPDVVPSTKGTLS